MQWAGATCPLGVATNDLCSECGLRECVQQNQTAFHQTLFVSKGRQKVERRWHNHTKGQRVRIIEVTRNSSERVWGSRSRYRAKTLEGGRRCAHVLSIAAQLVAVVSRAQVTPDAGAHSLDLSASSHATLRAWDDRLGSSELRRGTGTRPVALRLTQLRTRDEGRGPLTRPKPIFQL
jgi:hypothetical protein